MGPSGGVCALPGVGKRRLSGWEGRSRVEEGEGSEGLGVEREGVVCVCGVGTCEVGV